METLHRLQASDRRWKVRNKALLKELTLALKDTKERIKFIEASRTQSKRGCEMTNALEAGALILLSGDALVELTGAIAPDEAPQHASEDLSGARCVSILEKHKFQVEVHPCDIYFDVTLGGYKMESIIKFEYNDCQDELEYLESDVEKHNTDANIFYEHTTTFCNSAYLVDRAKPDATKLSLESPLEDQTTIHMESMPFFMVSVYG
jgi:hypothetical protein